MSVVINDNLSFSIQQGLALGHVCLPVNERGDWQNSLPLALKAFMPGPMLGLLLLLAGWGELLALSLAVGSATLALAYQLHQARDRAFAWQRSAQVLTSFFNHMSRVVVAVQRSVASLAVGFDHRFLRDMVFRVIAQLAGLRVPHLALTPSLLPTPDGLRA